MMAPFALFAPVPGIQNGLNRMLPIPTGPGNPITVMPTYAMAE
jgi:hypothetical protein